MLKRALVELRDLELRLQIELPSHLLPGLSGVSGQVAPSEHLCAPAMCSSWAPNEDCLA